MSPECPIEMARKLLHWVPDYTDHLVYEVVPAK